MALIYMLHKGYEAMDTPGTLLRICMPDFSKAFDRIDFNILSENFHRMGVHPVLINWIANFLTDRKQRIRIENHYSSWKTINAGVPQGTKLGPLLFLIMVNDLSISPDTVKFADDILPSGRLSVKVKHSRLSYSHKLMNAPIEFHKII